MISKTDAIAKCRILGVSVNASLDDLKLARNRLTKIYHPDKYPTATPEQLKDIRDKFHMVNEAYLYLKDNHKAIKEIFLYVPEFSLTSKAHKILRSHYVYSEVANY